MIKCEKKVFNIILSCWCIYIIFTLFTLFEDMQRVFSYNKYYVRLLELCMFSAIVLECYFLSKKKKSWESNKKIGFVVVIAFLVRIFFLQYSNYIPTSDFKNYLEGSCFFATQGFSGGLYTPLKNYAIPEFAGLAVINGTLLKIFSPTLLGMQVLNIVYTTGICMMIWLLAQRYNEDVAIIATSIYTFYPVSIVSSQITSNTHGATFFLLLGLWLYILAMEKSQVKYKLLFLIFSSGCFVFSNFYHPSVILTLCALMVYSFISECIFLVKNFHEYLKRFLKDVKEISREIFGTIFVIILYFVLLNTTLYVFKASGFVEETKGASYLSKLVVGFNFDTRGAYSGEDYKYIKSLDRDIQAKECINIVKDRIEENGIKETWNLLHEKNQKVWFGTDNYFSFHRTGEQKEYEQYIENTSDIVVKEMYENKKIELISINTTMYMSDTVLVYLIWIFAVIGMIKLIIEDKLEKSIFLVMFIPLGWMMFVMITEYQPRYRYVGMTIIVIFAAIGINFIRNIVKKCYKQIREKSILQ